MITRPCTTPWKKAYTTKEDAEFQRTTDGLTYGTALYTYRCICGLWHLSRSDREHLPAYEQPKPEDVARIRSLDNDTFTQLVDGDVKHTIPIPDRLALRHPDNLTRWRWALKNLRSRVNRQLSQTRDKTASSDWLTRARLYRDNLDLRLAECQRLRAQAATTRAA